MTKYTPTGYKDSPNVLNQLENFNARYSKLLEFVKSIAECEIHSSRVKWMVWDRAKELLKEIGELK